MASLELGAIEPLFKRLEQLRESGYVVHAPTWRDVGRPWPHPMVDDLAEAVDADSVGIEVERTDRGGKLVIFRRGWADLMVVSRGDDHEDVFENPVVRSARDVEVLVDRFLSLFPRQSQDN